MRKARGEMTSAADVAADIHRAQRASHVDDDPVRVSSVLFVVFFDVAMLSLVPFEAAACTAAAPLRASLVQTAFTPATRAERVLSEQSCCPKLQNTSAAERRAVCRI